MYKTLVAYHLKYVHIFVIVIYIKFRRLPMWHYTFEAIIINEYIIFYNFLSSPEELSMKRKLVCTDIG
jgi:hypothetical protein